MLEIACAYNVGIEMFVMNKVYNAERLGDSLHVGYGRTVVHVSLATLSRCPSPVVQSH